MNADNTTEHFARLFDVPEAHCLTESSFSTVERNSTVFETRWLEERDAELKLVARFRAWSNRQLKPPYRRQTGWERFSRLGNLLDREVRYSKRNDNEYLH